MVQMRRASSTWYSILKVPRCRIQSFSFHGSTYVGRLTESLFPLRSSFGLLGISNGFDYSQGHAFHARRISRAVPSGIGERITNIKSSEPSKRRNESLDRSVKQNPRSKLVSRRFTSIQCSDAEPKILEKGYSKHQVRIFVIDIETTGFYRESERIIEIAIRDLSGGKNSCFQTLVNPERHVPNSHIHGITTKMVNQTCVPRMEDLIPILIDYVNSRLHSGEIALFAAHNARHFDVPFLTMESSRCSSSINIPENWLFLDTLPLAREFMKLNGSFSSKLSLQALRVYFDIPLVGSAHRAMSDVNLLSTVLERMVSDMNLTVPDLLVRSFQACPDDLKEDKDQNKNKNTN